MSFLNIYNHYKQLLVEGTIKTVSFPLQQYIFKHMLYISKDTEYKNLPDHLKQFVDKQLNILKSQITHEINLLKSKVDIDLQFESWLYDLTATWYRLGVEEDNTNYETSEQMRYNTNCYNIPELYSKWKQLCKSPKIDKTFKDIRIFKDLEELKQFVTTNQHMLLKKEKIDFNKIYSNQKYDIYTIGVKDKHMFQQIYGKDGYDCGWCVVNPDKNMFELYLMTDDANDYTPSKDCYYLWTYKGTNKPFALLHKKSRQFKDIHNESMYTKDDNVKYDSNILDGLCHIFKYSEWESILHEGDFSGYAAQVNKYSKQRSKTLGQYCCEYIWKGATYDFETNTVDCHNNKITFTDDCFDNNGTFDFKLINMNKDLSELFSQCDIKQLPSDFSIPDGTIYCKQMFYNCEHLIKLPDGFKIPKSVQNCKRMFEYCTSLQLLPGSFKIENGELFDENNYEDKLNDMFWSSGLTYEDVVYVLENSNCPDNLIQTIADNMI